MLDLQVKISPTHGQGVFANRDFKTGEIVVPWVAEKILTKQEVALLPEFEQQYVSQMNDGKYILFAAPARYVNHSCEPNTKAENNANVAICDIKKGEEIMTDYELEGAVGSFKCACGSKKCRGIVG